jgi:hypothetical protein
MLLSVLDQTPVPEGSTGRLALQNTLDLVRLADRLGYEVIADAFGLTEEPAARAA